MDQGIAGMVATSGQILNIPDAYDNPNFNQTIDKKTGYRTKAILCMPIKADDQVIGVLQLINKLSGGGVFTMDDEDIMNIFLSIAGPLLAESNLYAQIQGKAKGKGVEGVEREVSKDSYSFSIIKIFYLENFCFCFLIYRRAVGLLLMRRLLRSDHWKDLLKREKKKRTEQWHIHVSRFPLLCGSLE